MRRTSSRGGGKTSIAPLEVTFMTRIDYREVAERTGFAVKPRRCRTGAARRQPGNHSLSDPADGAFTLTS
jgi:hypothetical protein